MTADKLERWGLLILGTGLIVYGLASLGGAAFDSFSWKDIGIGVVLLVIGVSLIVRTSSRRAAQT